MKAFKDKIIQLAAIVLSFFYCMEIIAKENRTQMNWIGMGIAVFIVVVWLISVGVFFNKTSHNIEKKKAEKAALKAEEIFSKSEEAPAADNPPAAEDAQKNKDNTESEKEHK